LHKVLSGGIEAHGVVLPLHERQPGILPRQSRTRRSKIPELPWEFAIFSGFTKDFPELCSAPAWLGKMSDYALTAPKLGPEFRSGDRGGVTREDVLGGHAIESAHRLKPYKNDLAPLQWITGEGKSALKGDQGTMTRKRTYTRAFKRKALELAKSGQKSINEIERDQDMIPALLHKWKARMRDDGGQAAPSQRSLTSRRRTHPASQAGS
jgi:hypothetical protein